MGNSLVKNRNPVSRPIPQQNYAYPVDQEPVIVQPVAQPAQFFQSTQPGQQLQSVQQLQPAQHLQPVQQLQPMQQHQQQGSFGSEASFAMRPIPPRYPGLPMPNLPRSPAQSTYESNLFLSSLTGWSTADIERLRHEFTMYSSPYGSIDREGFRKLFVSALLNMPWEAVERESESAFRSFDINQTGTLDFNEYITACTRLIRAANSTPPMYPPYN